MKKLIRVVVAVVSLSSLGAWADCVVDGYGHGVCSDDPRAPCVVDGYGHAVCGSCAGSQCIVDAYGKGVCN